MVPTHADVVGVGADLLRPSRYISACPYKGIASYYHLEVGGKTHENIVWYYPEPSDSAAQVKGRVAFARGVDIVE